MSARTDPVRARRRCRTARHRLCARRRGVLARRRVLTPRQCRTGPLAIRRDHLVCVRWVYPHEHHETAWRHDASTAPIRPLLYRVPSRTAMAIQCRVDPAFAAESRGPRSLRYSIIQNAYTQARTPWPRTVLYSTAQARLHAPSAQPRLARTRADCGTARRSAAAAAPQLRAPQLLLCVSPAPRQEAPQRSGRAGLSQSPRQCLKHFRHTRNARRARHASGARASCAPRHIGAVRRPRRIRALCGARRGGGGPRRRTPAAANGAVSLPHVHMHTLSSARSPGVGRSGCGVGAGWGVGGWDAVACPRATTDAWWQRR